VLEVFSPPDVASRVYSAALSASQPTAQSELSKICRKAGDSNALCPEGPWLSRPVGYQLPEPSGYKVQIGFKEKLQA
jgi:hypothetical protein